MNVDNKTPLQSFINQKADTLMQCGNYSIDIPPLKRDEQYRFHFDATACVGCHCCEAACNEQNGNPADVKWRRVGEMEGDTWIKNDMVKLGVAPHLPDIEVTKPTTRYTLYDNMPMLKPADAHIIKPAHAELPLLFMTVLTQMSLGGSGSSLFGRCSLE